MKKICVFLAVPYRGGTLEGAKNILKMIHAASEKDGQEIELTFSCVKDYYKINEDFRELIDIGINIVETEWTEIEKEHLEYGMHWMNRDKELLHDHYWVPNNSAKNFVDQDFWLFISDRCNQPIAPLVPYGMIVYDYIQRYLPEIFPDPDDTGSSFLYSARGADFVMCTTPQTMEDANQYAGVSRDRLVLAPMEFNPKLVEPERYFNEDFDYIIWTTNTTQHKNHLNALEGIAKYYSEKDGKFKIVITGAMTDYFREDAEYLADYTEDVKKKIFEDKRLAGNIIIAGELDDRRYVSVLSNAKFLMHPTIYDNGTYSVIEAAYYGVPSISSSYGQMRFIDERFKLNMGFFRSDSAEEIASAMKDFELNCAEKAGKLPGREFLESFTYSKLADEYWSLIKERI